MYETNRTSLYSEDREDKRRYNEADDHYRSRRTQYTSGRNQQRDHYHPYKRPARDNHEDRESHQQLSQNQRQRQPRYHTNDQASRELIYRPVIRSSSSLREHPYAHQDRHTNQELNTPKTRFEGANIESSHSKTEASSAVGGVPPRELLHPIYHEAIDKAKGEVRDAMRQYTSCADPTESAARKERMRQA